LVVSGGEGRGVTVSIQRQVQHVDTKAQEVEQTAAEVRDIKEQVELLVQNANTTNDKIAAGEKNVSNLVSDAEKKRLQIQEINRQASEAVSAVKVMEANVAEMRDNVRQTWRSLFESFAYSIGTRDIFPIPPSVAAEIDRHLNILATFAYPDERERQEEITKVMNAIKAAQPHPR
jgi:hypothetical protein